MQKEEEIEKIKKKNISIHLSDKELDLQLLNNNIFNENKNKSNNSHSNIIKDYYQNVIDENIDSMNNQFNNINLSGNEIDENNKNNENMNNDIIEELNNNYIHNNENYPKINSNIIINNNSNYINPNNIFPKTFDINKEEQKNINFQNLSPNIFNSNSEQIQSNSYFNEIPYMINQPQINMNPSSNINQKYSFGSRTNTNKKNKFYKASISPIPYSDSQNALLSDKREEYLINNCVGLCKEQAECRQLQKILELNPSLASNVIYSKIKEKIQEISFDQFGNYFIQKVIENLNDDQIREILYKKLSHNFRSFCFNQHGTRVVQKIFEKIINNEPLLNYFDNLLITNLKDFVIDQNASHIIIKYVNTLQSPKNDFIIQFLLENSFYLAAKKYSCCVLQKCIEYSNDIQKKAFLKSIAEKSFGLFNDQYGNYVVQYCINLCDYEINKIFIKNILINIIQFSTQKYSSNIIEKCIDCCDETSREIIIQKFCDKEIVEKLLFDMYGNYVLQKVINLSKEPLTSKFLEMIGPLMKNLNNYNFGQKLYNKLMTSFPNLSVYMGISTKPRKNKKFKNKKMKNNDEYEGYLGNNNFNNINVKNNGLNKMNMEELVNNIYANKGYNINNLNNNINNQTNNGQILMIPGINNYFIPLQLNNNINNINNINNTNPNNISLQNLLNNNYFAMNSNFNHLLQLQQQLNQNNNIDIQNIYFNSNH